MNKSDIAKAFLTAIEQGEIEVARSHIAEAAMVSGLTTEPLKGKDFLDLQAALVVGMPNWSYNLKHVIENEFNVEGVVQITAAHTKPLSVPQMGLDFLEPSELQIVQPLQNVRFNFLNEKIASVNFEEVPDAGFTSILKQLGETMLFGPEGGKQS